MFNLWHFIRNVLEWASLYPSSLGLSVLPALVCLFPSPNQGSFLSLLFQIDFQFLALSLLLLVPHWCECWTSWSCPRGSLHYPCLFRFIFLLVLLIGFYFLMFQITDLILSFIHSTVVSEFFVSDWIFFMLLRSSLSSSSILIPSGLNSAFDRLLISI